MRARTPRPRGSGGSDEGGGQAQGEQIQRALKPWSKDFLSAQQVADTNLAHVWRWLADGKPEWDAVRGLGPSSKAYWQQFKFLRMEDGVVYRVMELLRDMEGARQLLLPSSLHEEFLTLVHAGIVGHLGAAKTRAHMGRRAYWFQWQMHVDVYCRNCPTCGEYCKGRAAPRQGKLQPMVLRAPVKRWACDLVGPSPPPFGGIHTSSLRCACF